MARFKISQYVPPGQHYHLAKVSITTPKAVGFHDHDYHEVFWIESGEGTHWVGGEAYPLQKGSLVLIRDRDEHTFTAVGARPLILVNVAFATRYWEEIRKRYFRKAPNIFSSPIAARHQVVTSEALFELIRLYRWLDHPERGEERLALFLMEVATNWISPRAAMPKEQAPEWLRKAVVAIAEPKYFSGGTRAFARLAGRGPDHVTREVRRWLGKTPTDLVNEARLHWAASQLAMTENSILDIAEDCGLPNLAHFYKLFKSHYQTTPRHYRLQARRIVLG